jgi:hypothetical protein
MLRMELRHKKADPPSTCPGPFSMVKFVLRKEEILKF